MESPESGSRPPVPVYVDHVQQMGAESASWIPPNVGGAGEPGVYMKSFIAEVPDLPEFEKNLPMLRAGGTGQAYAGEAQPEPYAATTWACDGDGD